MRFPAVLTLLVPAMAAVAAPVDGPPEPPAEAATDLRAGASESDDLEPRIRRFLDALRHGTTGDKLSWTAGLQFALLDLDELSPEDPGLIQLVVDELSAFVLHEPEPWVVARVLAPLTWWAPEENMAPVFRLVARHPSPSVRELAVDYAAEEEDAPALWDMWSEEAVSWLRAKVLTSLADEFPVERCADLAQEDDPDLAEAAMECLASEESSWAGDLLARLARSRDPHRQRAALRSLRRWLYDGEVSDDLADAVQSIRRSGVAPASRAALLSVMDGLDLPEVTSLAIEWSADERRDTALAAISLLDGTDDPEAIAALMDRAGNGPIEVRTAAIGALDAPVLSAGVEQFLVNLTRPPEPGAVRSAALQALSSPHWTRDRERAQAGAYADRIHLAPVIQAMAETDPDPGIREAAAAAAERFENGQVVIRISCGIGGASDILLAVEPPRYVESVRCWEAPRIECQEEAPCGEGLRILAGVGIRALERFDDGELTWRRLSLEGSDCWAPEPLVRPLEPSEEGAISEAAPATREFDLPRDVIATKSFVALEEAGLVETFDQGSMLVGVRLLVDPDDVDMLELLGQAGIWAHTPLGGAVRRLLRESFGRAPDSAPPQEEGSPEPAAPPVR